MVSFQTPGESPVGAPGGQAMQPPPPRPGSRPGSTQPREDDAENPWANSDSNQYNQQNSTGADTRRKPVPNALQSGLGSTPRPPIPQMQHHDDVGGAGSKTEDNSSKRSTEPIDRVPSILRPGGKSPNLNPFRNKEANAASASAAAAGPLPTEAMSKMSLDSATNNPWSSALHTQRTGTPASEDSRTQHAPPTMPPEFQQDPWSRQDAVELDATSYAHPAKPLSVPTPEEQSVWGGESQIMTASKSQVADSQSTLVKPADEFSQIFDGQHAWDDLGRAQPPRVKRSETNKTVGEDSDQDDWNMIDSETSSVAGDAADQAGAGDARKTENQAKRPPIPGMGAPPVPVMNAAAVPKIITPQTSVATGSTTPYVDAPATPWDSPPSVDNNEMQKNNASLESEVQKGKEAAPQSQTYGLLPTQTESKSEALLIEPLGYETPAESSQSQHAPQSTGLLPEQDEERPALPPRQPESARRWSATRQPVDGKTETYQIKNIRWNDSNSNKNPRVSPILVQNENGPCPLVALVNALSLTTPADIPETTLVQVLRSRERISLNLVLDAVFDELMSPRRTSSEDALPDISELYEFLQSLHTGMNVNPRFIPTEQMVKAYKRSSLTHLHPTQRDALMPGTFENSLEMKLYATFSIPLIHGWLPARSEPVYEAFERQAATYEDAQNLLFREEELEAKLLDPQGGLSGPEQQLYQDVMSIKMFMNESATQLTPWGIEVISKAIRPGTFAILFRNDHFSTLYCHPFTMQLLTLVTDAGYSSHEEVVWESLEDVNGEMSELYSGDFRPVGSPNPAGPSSSSRQSNNDPGGEWTRVPNRHGKERQQESDMDIGMGSGIDHEQEDRDLALALQLQEEEEQKEREEQERRRRESRLSEQFIEQQGRQPPQPVARDPRRRTSSSGGGGGGPISPGRSSSSNVNVTVSSPGGSISGRQSSDQLPPPQPPRPQRQNIQPMVPPAGRPAGRPPVNRPVAAGEEAPPSYEAAQHDRRYEPGQGGGAAAAPGGGGGGGMGGMNSGMAPGPQGGLRPSGYGLGQAGYRPSRGGGRMSQGSGRDRDRGDCVVM